MRGILEIFFEFSNLYLPSSMKKTSSHSWKRDHTILVHKEAVYGIRDNRKKKNLGEEGEQDLPSA